MKKRIRKAVNEFNDAIIEIWRKHGKGQDRYPSLYPMPPEEVKRIDILFVGINPSFASKDSEGDIGRKVVGWKKEGKDITDDKKQKLIKHEYGERYGKMEYVKRYKEVRTGGEKSYKYFQSIVGFKEEIERELEEELSWYSVDLFSVRHRNMKDAINETKIRKNKDLFTGQLELSFKLIKDLDPKIIVVASAAASHVIHRLIGNEDKVTWRKVENFFKGSEKDISLDVPEDPKTKLEIMGKPWFFSTMLSGGRMDVYSRKRLINEITIYMASRG